MAERLTGRLLAVGGSSCGCAALEYDGARITAVEHGVADGRSRLIMPPLVNAHDHVRGVRPIALGAFDLPLELWQMNLSGVPACDPYLVAAAALGRQALSGVGSIMVHYTRPQRRDDLPGELDAVVRAAHDVGVRIAIAVSLRDQHPLGYGDPERILAALEPADRAPMRERFLFTPRSPQALVALTEEIAERHAGRGIVVQFGPTGMEWCSRALLEAIAARSAETGRRVHMHLLESRLQREYLDHAYAGGPIRYLDDIGLLSPRLSVAHGIWLREDEIELLARRGVTVAVNASSNFILRSGVAPVAAYARAGVPVALGLDGFSIDDDDDALRELRLHYLLHHGTALERRLEPAAVFESACSHGRQAVLGEPAAAWQPGAPADLLALDYAAMSADVLLDDQPEDALVLHRASRRSVEKLIVGGRTVVAGGRLAGLDLDAVHRDLQSQLEAGRGEFNHWQRTARRIRERLRGFYASGGHCE